MGAKTIRFHRAPAGLLAVALLIMAGTAILSAQTTVLPPRFAVRALTSGDISAYKLPSTTQMSGGLTTVALGEPAYVEVQIDASIPASQIAGVIWILSYKPAGSSATLVASPLGSNVPILEPSDRMVYQVAGRQMLKPDVRGEYVVTATVTAGSSGTATVSQTIIGGTYVGAATCAKCHGGGLAEVMSPTWSKTLHAGIFTQGINGELGSYSASCLGCHTVGYDLNNTVDNGGFSATSKKLGWTFPTTLQEGNFAALPAALQNVGNIQCENCHGPGSEHASVGGTPFTVGLPSNSGACTQCHDAPTHHIKGNTWSKSLHASTTRETAGNATCAGCHSGTGFMNRMNGVKITDASYHAIDCVTCHEPHGQTQPANDEHLVRNMASATLADGTKITGSGTGTLCMQCHQARVNASTYVDSTLGTAHYGPHLSPQTDMLMGTNGYTYGQQIPSSAHQFVTTNACVDCHMQTVDATSPAFMNAGDHTFSPSYTPANGATIQLVGACQNCHGKEIKTFDFALFDYNGDGKIEGVQTEVQHLLDQLSTMLPPDNKVKTSLTIDSTWTKPQLEAAYNWQFVNNDGSKGIHNTAYAVGLLKGSINNLKSH